MEHLSREKFLEKKGQEDEKRTHKREENKKSSKEGKVSRCGMKCVKRQELEGRERDEAPMGISCLKILSLSRVLDEKSCRGFFYWLNKVWNRLEHGKNCGVQLAQTMLFIAFSNMLKL